MGKTFLSFLEKNDVFFESDKKTLYSGGLDSLTGSDLMAVEEKKILNLFTFLKVTETTKKDLKDLILNCVTLNSYDPLFVYIKDKRDSLRI